MIYIYNALLLLLLLQLPVQQLVLLLLLLLLLPVRVLTGAVRWMQQQSLQLLKVVLNKPAEPGVYMGSCSCRMISFFDS